MGLLLDPTDSNISVRVKITRGRRTKEAKSDAERETTKMSETVKLISMEGFEFVIDREAAMVSQTIRSMLTSPGFSLLFSLISIFFLFSSFMQM